MSRGLIGVLLALAALACVTINVYFPESEIKDLSQRIEEEIQRQAQQAAAPPAEGPPPEQTAPPPPPPDDAPSSKAPRSGLLDQLLGVSPALAAEVPDPDVSNPAIRKIIAARAARLAEIARFKAAGVLGENNQALLEVRNLEAGGDLKTRAAIQRLVREENADREAMFKEIAAAKGVDASQIPRIRETYAATLRENAAPGEWLQWPDGAWKQKQ